MSVKQPGGGDGKAGSAPGIDAPPVRHLARPRDACRLAGVRAQVAVRAGHLRFTGTNPGRH